MSERINGQIKKRKDKLRSNQFQFLGETITSKIPLEGDKLERWRSRQTTKYLDSGLTREEADELLMFVETPFGCYPGDVQDRFEHLAKKAVDGGILERSNIPEAFGL